MSAVVIDDIIPRTQITATASQTVFNTNWTADDATDIIVYDTPAGTPADDATQLVSPSLYTVAFVGSTTQIVQVTFLTGVPAGNTITIIRATPAERLNLYINTNFTTSMLNEDFGILTLVDQQNQMYNTVINPGYNVSAPIGEADKLLPQLGPLDVWQMNSDGTGIEAVPLTGGGSGGLMWNEVSMTSAQMEGDNGYVANNSMLVTLTLPALAEFGTIVACAGQGTGLLKVAQNAGQTIHISGSSTTPGTGGSLETLYQYDSFQLLCITENTDWIVLQAPQGGLTIV